MRRRLLSSYLALTVVVLLALEIPLALAYRTNERARVATGLQRDAFSIANYSEETLESDAHARVQQHVEDYHRRTGGQALVVDASQRVIGDSTAPVGGSSGVDASAGIRAALQGSATSGARSGPSSDQAVLFAAVPVETSGRVLGAVEVTYPADRVDDRVHAYWLLLLGGGLACLAAAAVLGIFLSRWVTQPLVPLRRAAARLGRGDLDARVGVHAGPPEVRELSRTFDDMAARLEELVSAQDQFVADASHQLRTPLTGLRLRLENLEQEVSGDDASDDLAGALRETQRMSRLVDGLLALAQADRRSDGPGRERVDLEGAIDERLDAWRPIADERDVHLVRDGTPLVVEADPDRFSQVLDNLLANAIDASPNGERVVVKVSRSGDGGRVEVHVVDHGDGLDADQRRHAFDRFWRGESNVAVDASPRLGGSGLGLAIVRRLASADGATSELRDAPGGGIDAVVAYPADRR
jgi:signal transduction histidine kinase